MRLFVFFLFSWIGPATATTDGGKKRSETSASAVSSNVTSCKNEEKSPTAALSVAYTFQEIHEKNGLFIEKIPRCARSFLKKSIRFIFERCAPGEMGTPDVGPPRCALQEGRLWTMEKAPQGQIVTVESRGHEVLVA